MVSGGGSCFQRRKSNKLYRCYEKSDTIKSNQPFLVSKQPKNETTGSHLNRSYGAFFLRPGAYTRPGSQQSLQKVPGYKVNYRQAELYTGSQASCRFFISIRNLQYFFLQSPRFFYRRKLNNKIAPQLLALWFQINSSCYDDTFWL